MSRSSLYAVLAVLAVVVVAFGIYYVYQEQQRTTLSISVDEGGVRVQGPN
ncbi:hypothetical protein SAMN02983003_3636 [Devosia enhydra]|uniref:Uncharacterized protein n=1 Tax=Devosia enhydra TaxID=665118 RepID=A0A1K2I241_9HYPH|nr:hypothetical protein [Devosia enhydra]SFZ86454.1 hypothetical protein SAMN02983003_3636 [Devosia enhydra]